MTKGNREARMKARMERQMFENASAQGKRQFTRENKNARDNYSKESVVTQNEEETREDLIIGRNAVIEV